MIFRARVLALTLVGFAACESGKIEPQPNPGTGGRHVDAGGGGAQGGAVAEGGTGPGGMGGTRQNGADGGAADAGVAKSALFVRVDSNLLIETSCDGKAWKKANLEAPVMLGTLEGNGFRFVSQLAGILMATGGGSEAVGSLQKLYTSEDGLTWKARRTAQGDWLAGTGYLDTASGPLWIAGGGNGTRLYSSDKGVTWRPASTGCTLRTMASGGGRVVGFCNEGTVIGSAAPAGAADPVKWTTQAGNGDGWGRGAYGNGRFVGVWGGATSTPACKVLVDGTDTWRPCGRGVAEVVMFDDGWFYAAIASIEGDARWSQDGFTWSKRPEPAWRGLGTQVAAAKGTYVRTNTAGLVAASVAAGICP